MSFTFRRKRRPETGKGVGGFLRRPTKFDMESDSALNMTNDIIQGNSLKDEEVELKEPKKRKVPPIKSSPKKPKIDMAKYNEGKYMNSFYKKK